MLITPSLLSRKSASSPYQPRGISYFFDFQPSIALYIPPRKIICYAALGVLTQNVLMMKMPPTAVLVIDVQQALCEGPGAAWRCAEMIAHINDITAAARAAQQPVIWVQHAEPGLELDSPGWQLANGLHTDSADLRSNKTTGDAFWHTDLQAQLQAHGIVQLIVCGMHTEYCVDVSTRAALRLGYPVLLVEDAHTSSGNAAITAQQVIAHHNITLSSTSSFAARARLVTTTALVQQLRHSAAA